ncbi:nectin-4 [Eucyclogobius newberryi]|uniref:nectin-4 n=1 Tax=Eucyclogobius newberryi TaxID=166745 RepID=UPI003B5AD25F
MKRMTRQLVRIAISLCVLQISAVWADFSDVPPGDAVRSLAEEETVLPCVYEPSQKETTVQVTWSKEKSDGTKEQIILAHHLNGQTAFGTWSRRVRFKNSDPTVDSSLIIMSTELGDAGHYSCQISTFPLGNFEKDMDLTVWTIPISSLEPVVLKEGSYGVVATCRSTALPTPQLSWDTELTGQSTNRTYDNGVVTSQYALYPLRSMNHKRLDCLVWHESFKGPKRLSNKLVVHYPPHAEITGYKDDWHQGLEKAALKCVSGGNPAPHLFKWLRDGEAVPEGAVPQPDGTLVFERPLSMSDKGTYQCVAINGVGTGKAELQVTVGESVKQTWPMENMLMIVVGAVGGGLLLLMLVVIVSVTCHHRRSNKKLKRELTEKTQEISSLSRQASIRRVNSVSTDARGATEENIPLRVEGTLRTSLSSLGEHAFYRDSHSTISGRGGVGGGGGGGAVDYLGRPVLHNNSRRLRERLLLDRDEESRLRVENYVRNSNKSLQETRYQPPLMPTSYPIQSTEVVRHINGTLLIPGEGRGSRQSSVIKTPLPQPPMSSPSPYPPATYDEDEVDEGLGGPANSQDPPEYQDSETNSSQVSYPNSNGSLRPKIRPLTPIVSPHASLIHKAQIV